MVASQTFCQEFWLSLFIELQLLINTTYWKWKAAFRRPDSCVGSFLFGFENTYWCPLFSFIRGTHQRTFLRFIRFLLIWWLMLLIWFSQIFVKLILSDRLIRLFINVWLFIAKCFINILKQLRRHIILTRVSLCIWIQLLVDLRFIKIVWSWLAELIDRIYIIQLIRWSVSYYLLPLNIRLVMFLTIWFKIWSKLGHFFSFSNVYRCIIRS